MSQIFIPKYFYNENMKEREIGFQTFSLKLPKALSIATPVAPAVPLRKLKEYFIYMGQNHIQYDHISMQV